VYLLTAALCGSFSLSQHLLVRALLLLKDIFGWSTGTALAIFSRNLHTNTAILAKAT